MGIFFKRRNRIVEHDFSILRKDIQKLFNLIRQRSLKEAEKMMPNLYVKHGRTPYVEYLLLIEDALQSIKGGEDLKAFLGRIQDKSLEGNRRLSEGENVALQDLLYFSDNFK